MLLVCLGQFLILQMEKTGPEKTGDLPKIAQFGSNLARAELGFPDFCPRRTQSLFVDAPKGQEPLLSLVPDMASLTESHPPSAAFRVWLGWVSGHAHPFSCLLENTGPREAAVHTAAWVLDPTTHLSPNSSFS